MSDESQDHEEEANEEESLELVETDEEDEVDELEVDESDEIDETEEIVEEKVVEKGAYLVLGQGDFSTAMSNRGADDPGDNTLSAPQSICKFGEMVFIMGPTGAGKSSVLRAIYKDPNISSGKIFFEDADISDIKKHKISFFRRKIGMIFNFS